LRYKGNVREYKIPAFDVCYYEILPPPWKYMSGETTLTIKSFEKGVSLYLTAGKSVRNMDQAIVPRNRTVRAGETFKIKTPN